MDTRPHFNRSFIHQTNACICGELRHPENGVSTRTKDVIDFAVCAVPLSLASEIDSIEIGIKMTNGTVAMGYVDWVTRLRAAKNLWNIHLGRPNAIRVFESARERCVCRIHGCVIEVSACQRASPIRIKCQLRPCALKYSYFDFMLAGPRGRIVHFFACIWIWDICISPNWNDHHFVASFVFFFSNKSKNSNQKYMFSVGRAPPAFARLEAMRTQTWIVNILKFDPPARTRCENRTMNILRKYTRYVCINRKMQFAIQFANGNFRTHDLAMRKIIRRNHERDALFRCKTSRGKGQKVRTGGERLAGLTAVQRCGQITVCRFNFAGFLCQFSRSHDDSTVRGRFCAKLVIESHRAICTHTHTSSKWLHDGSLWARRWNNGEKNSKK